MSADQQGPLAVRLIYGVFYEDKVYCKIDFNGKALFAWQPLEREEEGEKINSHSHAPVVSNNLLMVDCKQV